MVWFSRNSLTSSSSNLAGRFGKPIYASCCERHLGPRGGKQGGEVSADTARGAGYERHFAGKLEARQPSHEVISLARSRNSYFWILPVEVLGNGPNTILRGTL